MSSADSEHRDIEESPLAHDEEDIRSQNYVDDWVALGARKHKGSNAIPDLKTQGAFPAAVELRKAYVTILAGNKDGAVFGAVGLAKGLTKVRSQYPLVVAALPDVPEECRKSLASHFCRVIEIKPVYHPDGNQTGYSKFFLFGLEEYDKMIYLDGNVQVFENIDQMFDYPDSNFYAALDCFCEESWKHSPQHKIGYCQHSPNKVQWDPALGPKPALYFNDGMFVFEPSSATYLNLVKTVNNIHKTCPTTAFAEQDLLNVFLKDKLLPLPLHYNLTMPMLWRHPEAVELDKVKVVNYCAIGSKPWSYTGKEENMERDDVKMLVNKWWEIYNDDSLDSKKVVTSAEAEKGTDQVNLEPFEAAFSETGAVEFIDAPTAA